FSASFPNARLKVQPPDAENRTSGGVGGAAGAIPPSRPNRSENPYPPFSAFFPKIKNIYFIASNHKLQLLPMRQQTSFKTLAQKAADGFAPFLTVIESPMVYIHSYKFV